MGEVDIFYMTRIQRERFPDDDEYEKVKVEKHEENKKDEITKAIKATQESQQFGESDDLDVPAFIRRRK